MPSPDVYNGKIQYWFTRQKFNMMEEQQNKPRWEVYFNVEIPIKPSEKHPETVRWDTYKFNFREEELMEDLLEPRSKPREKAFEFTLDRFLVPPASTDRLVWKREATGEEQTGPLKKLVDFAIVHDSVGMKTLLHKFAQLCRAHSTPVHPILAPLLFLCFLKQLDPKKGKPPKKGTKAPNKGKQPNSKKKSSSSAPPKKASSPPKISMVIGDHLASAYKEEVDWWTMATTELCKMQITLPEDQRPANKSGAYVIADPEVKGQNALFIWVQGNFVKNHDGSRSAVGKCVRFPNTVLHPRKPGDFRDDRVIASRKDEVAKTSRKLIQDHCIKVGGEWDALEGPFQVAAITRDHFHDRKNTPLPDFDFDAGEIPILEKEWWIEIKILAAENNDIVDEIQDLLDASRHKHGPKFTLETYLAKVIDRVTFLPSSTNPKLEGKIKAMYKIGKDDLEKSKAIRHFLKAMHTPSSRPSRSRSVANFERLGERHKTISKHGNEEKRRTREPSSDSQPNKPRRPQSVGGRPYSSADIIPPMKKTRKDRKEISRGEVVDSTDPRLQRKSTSRRSRSSSRDPDGGKRERRSSSRRSGESLRRPHPRNPSRERTADGKEVLKTYSLVGDEEDPNKNPITEEETINKYGDKYIDWLGMEPWKQKELRLLRENNPEWTIWKQLGTAKTLEEVWQLRAPRFRGGGPRIGERH